MSLYVVGTHILCYALDVGNRQAHKKGKTMLKDCDMCNSQFDVFEEGNVNKYNTALCGKCWTVEAINRGLIKESN